MEIEQFPPYREGQPIGFVYEERNHPPSYHVISRDKEGRLIQTGDIAELAKAVKGVPEIVWLTREQIDALDIHIGKEGMRPLTEEEESKLTA